MTYRLTVTKDGKKELVPKGKLNVYEFIQSFKDECDVESIIKKYNMIGDPSILNVRDTYYGDFTNMPRTLAEVHKMSIEASEYFNSLPLEVRREFNFNEGEFYAQIGSDKYYDVFKKAGLLNVDVPSETAQFSKEFDAVPEVEKKGDLNNE
ncbi:minor capsid protein [Capybara microvirus Cap3_SP_469]|nr:minor capsid protein [Capybara microvirus Cap3_SP_469]